MAHIAPPAGPTEGKFLLVSSKQVSLAWAIGKANINRTGGNTISLNSLLSRRVPVSTPPCSAQP
jgi:hypothetical protein